jgi:hypothetical protein
VAEQAGLENRSAGNRTEGSNPSLSASQSRSRHRSESAAAHLEAQLFRFEKGSRAMLRLLASSAPPTHVWLGRATRAV